MNFKFQISNITFSNNVLLLIIIVMAGVLRFYQLGTNPPSLDWDEVSIGYNAYSLLKTGKDEFGNAWPVSIRSFEDYKPAVYTYLVIPSVAIFGLSEFAVRLPSAIIGVFTVITMYSLVQQSNILPHLSVLDKRRISLLTTFLIAISPWHLQFSRVGFEANTALFFVIIGILFCYRGLRKGKWWLLAVVSFVIAFYSYHSPRLVVPFLLAGFFVIHFRDIWKKRSWLLISIIMGIFLLIPFFKEFQHVRARFKSVTVTDQPLLKSAMSRAEIDQNNHDLIGGVLHSRPVVLSQTVIAGYLDHFDLDFLFLNGDANPRHGAVDMGMHYLWVLPFLLVGTVFLVKNRQLFLLWWLAVAPIASALTEETPHAVRSLLSLPVHLIVAAMGLWVIFYFHRSFGGQIPIFKKRITLIVFIVLVSLNLNFYLESYYVFTPIESAKKWQYGYKEAVCTTREYEDVVERIIFTFAYDQPHAFVLFYRQIDPTIYQDLWLQGVADIHHRRLGKYEFRTIDWEKDKNLTHTLLVGTAKEIPDSALGIVKEIYFPDGTIAFRIVKQ